MVEFIGFSNQREFKAAMDIQGFRALLGPREVVGSEMVTVQPACGREIWRCDCMARGNSLSFSLEVCKPTSEGDS